MTEERLLTPAETATRLRASLPTLARWRCEGTGPKYLKRGGRVFYRDSELTEYEDGNMRTKTRDSE